MQTPVSFDSHNYFIRDENLLQICTFMLFCALIVLYPSENSDGFDISLIFLHDLFSALFYAEFIDWTT